MRVGFFGRVCSFFGLVKNECCEYEAAAQDVDNKIKHVLLTSTMGALLPPVYLPVNLAESRPRQLDDEALRVIEEAHASSFRRIVIGSSSSKSRQATVFEARLSLPAC